MTDLQKTGYDAYWNHRSSSGNRFRFNVFLSWIARGATVLDAGCGDGFLGGRLIHEKECRVSGMDLSPVALERARERGLTTINGSLDELLPFPDGAFEYVISSEALEHIIHSEGALKELYRVASKAVILSVPNTGYWHDRISLLLGRFPRQWIHQPWEHIRFWTMGDFRRTLASVGMRPTKVAAGSGRRWLRDLLPSLFARQVCYYIEKR